MSEELFTVWQSHLASRLGLSIEEIRLAKKGLVEGTDWALVGNRIKFTEKGAQEVAAVLGCSIPPAPKLLGFGAVPVEIPALPSDSEPPKKNHANGAASFLVIRKTANPHILEAYPEGSDPAVRANQVRIRVKDSQNFTRGMKISARPCLAAGLYEFTGRVPRWPGKY